MTELADRPRVLIAHALTVYAEPLAVLLAERRPCLAVRLLDPAELDAAVAAHPGAVVVADRLTLAVERHAGGWLVYYPDHEEVAIVGGPGALRRIDRPALADVFAAIDALVAHRFPALRPDCLEAAASA